jgi:hypothetical protein
VVGVIVAVVVVNEMVVGGRKMFGNANNSVQNMPSNTAI